MSNNFNYVLLIHNNDNIFFPFYSSDSLEKAENVRWVVCDKVYDERWQVNRKKAIEFLTLNRIPAVDVIENEGISESSDWKITPANMVDCFKTQEKCNVLNLWEMLLIKVPTLNLKEQ